MKATGILAACVLTLALASAQAQEPAKEAPKLTKAQCVQCHGSIDALIKKNVQITVDGGKVNPHKHVPHDATTDEKFPECTVCHAQHAIMPPKGYKDKNANVEMCFECHHQYNFQPCKSCHK